MAEKKLSPSERAALIEKAFARLPGAKDDDDATAKQRHAADKKAASESIAAIIDAGFAVEFEPRDGFYCVRVEREGSVRRVTGPTAASAAVHASGVVK